MHEDDCPLFRQNDIGFIWQLLPVKLEYVAEAERMQKRSHPYLRLRVWW